MESNILMTNTDRSFLFLLFKNGSKIEMFVVINYALFAIILLKDTCRSYLRLSGDLGL